MCVNDRFFNRTKSLSQTGNHFRSLGVLRNEPRTLYYHPGGRLNIKMLSYQYRDSHVKDKTVSPTVLFLTWESPYLGKTVFILRRGPGALCNIGHPSETHFKLKSREVSFAHNPARGCSIVFAQSTSVIPSCSLQNFKTVGQLKRMLWTSELSWDLSLGWVSDGYPILHSTPDVGSGHGVYLFTWWRHQMETFSALLAICAGNSPVSGEVPAQRPVTRSFGISLICAWINGWVNNREAGVLRRYHAHYDVTVMLFIYALISLQVYMLQV